MVNVVEIHSCEVMQWRMRVLLLIPVGFREDGGVGDSGAREDTLSCGEKLHYFIGNVSVRKALIWQKIGTTVNYDFGECVCLRDLEKFRY